MTSRMSVGTSKHKAPVLWTGDEEVGRQITCCVTRPLLDAAKEAPRKGNMWKAYQRGGCEESSLDDSAYLALVQIYLPKSSIANRVSDDELGARS